MSRRLFSILAGLSALLFVLSASMWVRSWFATDDIQIGAWHPARRTVVLHVRNGADFLDIDLKHLAYPRYRPHAPSRSRIAGLGVAHESSPPSDFGYDAWVWCDHYVDWPSQSGWIECWRVQLRPWLLVLMAVILPTVWLMSLVHRWGLVRTGRCYACGYDLRASPSRCPECGTPRPAVTDVT